MFLVKEIKRNVEFRRWFGRNMGSTTLIAALGLMCPAFLKILESTILDKECFKAPFSLQAKQMLEFANLIPLLTEDIAQIVSSAREYLVSVAVVDL